MGIFRKDYVRTIVLIATSSRHSAWGISWGEAQRQSIYADPKYDDGYYPFSDPPSTGLGAARMSALLTYRSRDSFESRFGRNIPDASKRQTISGHRHPSEVLWQFIMMDIGQHAHPYQGQGVQLLLQRQKELQMERLMRLAIQIPNSVVRL